MGFWVSAGAMVAMVAVLLLQALNRGRRQALAAPGSEDLAVYRDQLAEIARDVSRGTLPPEEAQRLRTEVQRRMLDADRSARGATAAATPRLAVPALAVLALLAAALGLYVWLGAPGYPDLPLAGRLAVADRLYQTRPSQAEAEAMAPPQVEPQADPAILDLMAKLRAAMATRPDDLQGQELLARNEAALGNYIAARKAQEAVVRLKGDAATGADRARLGEMMIYAAGGIVTPEAEAVLIDTLRRDPLNGTARFYSGMMFLQVRRPDRAFSLWQPLLAEGPEDAPWIAPIRAEIEAVAAAAGIAYTLPPAKGPSAADVAAAQDMTDTDRQQMIRNMVEGLRTRLDAAGGPVEDWAKLIASLGVLGELDRAQAAYDKARAAFAGQDAALAALAAAAQQAGLAP